MSATQTVAPQASTPAPQLRNGLGTAALVLGIIGVVFAFVPLMWWLGFILGLLALIFGFVGRRRVKSARADNGGAALTGVLTGLAAMVTSTAMFIAFMAALGGVANSVDKALDQSTTHGTVTSDGVVTGEKDQDYGFSKLSVSRDGLIDTFEGSIVIRNNTAQSAEVIVTVDAYDGNENLGELNGSATLKPNSSSRIKLTSLDDFAQATDYKVEVSGF